MNNQFIIYTISLSTSILLALWFIPTVKKILIEKQLLVTDMNKLDQPNVPGLGGIAFVFAFIISINLTLLLNLVFEFCTIQIWLLLPAFLSILMMAFVGFIDDILMFPFRPLKPILTLLASMPLIVISYNDISLIRLPFLNYEIDPGIFYPLLIVPLTVIFCSNVFNVMADFDGLSPGNGMLISLSLFICSVISKETTSALLFITLFGVLVIFYFYNKFPAKIFSGNIGTLFIGSIFAIGGIVGNLKYALFIVMVPYIIHFILQERFIFRKFKILSRPRERGIPQEDGSIKSEYKKSYGLTHFLMIHVKKITEKKLVYFLMGIEAIFCIMAIVFHYQHLGLL